MEEFINTLLIACIPAVVSGVVSFFVSKSQANSEIKKLKIENEHEIKRLMEQHKIDIEAVREQHRLELESKEKDHQYKLAIMQKEHDNEVTRRERELEDTAKYNAVGGMFSSLFGGLMNSPEVQSELSQQLADALKKKESGD